MLVCMVNVGGSEDVSETHGGLVGIACNKVGANSPMQISTRGGAFLKTKLANVLKNQVQI